MESRLPEGSFEFVELAVGEDRVGGRRHFHGDPDLTEFPRAARQLLLYRVQQSSLAFPDQSPSAKFVYRLHHGGFWGPGEIQGPSDL